MLALSFLPIFLLLSSISSDLGPFQRKSTLKPAKKHTQTKKGSSIPEYVFDYIQFDAATNERIAELAHFRTITQLITLLNLSSTEPFRVA